MSMSVPTYERLALRPRIDEIRDAAGHVIASSSTLDDLFECMQCGAAVRSQERHNEWHSPTARYEPTAEGPTPEVPNA